jgi:hypothetical protein
MHPKRTRKKREKEGKKKEKKGKKKKKKGKGKGLETGLHLAPQVHSRPRGKSLSPSNLGGHPLFFLVMIASPRYSLFLVHKRRALSTNFPPHLSKKITKTLDFHLVINAFQANAA